MNEQFVVEQLETVYTAGLTPGKAWDAIKSQNGKPFTSRQLLDAVYGPTIEPAFVRALCECGRKRAIVRRGNVPSCDLCQKNSSPVGYSFGEIDDDETWMVKENGRPAFEWFAGHWWKLDGRTLERTAHRVKNANKIAELNRDSGRAKALKKKPEPAPKQKIITYVEWEDGSRLPFGVAPCWCPSVLAHHITGGTHEKRCPAHPEACDVCGEVVPARA